MRKICALLAVVGLFVACTYHNDAPVVVDGEVAESQKMDSLIADTTTVLDVRNVHVVDSARQVLLHEVFLLRIGSRYDSKSFGESKGSRGYREGHIINLIFEDLINNKKYLLTDNRIGINSYEFLMDKGENKYFIYKVVDKDYNNDGELSWGDIESLYISNIDGTSFAKITKDKELYKDGKWISLLQRYYFHTLEDSNKDGYFNTVDKKHYYYIEFKDGKYNTIEYYPLDNLDE